MEVCKCGTTKRKNPFKMGIFCPTCYIAVNNTTGMYKISKNKENIKNRLKNANSIMDNTFTSDNATARLNTVEGVESIQDCYFIMGGSGAGKTYTTYAIYHAFLSLGITHNLEILQAVEFFEKIKESFNTEENMLRYYTNLTYLAIDDLGTDKASEWSISILNYIIDDRGKNNKPTVITTNLNIDEVQNLYGERIRRRLQTFYKTIKL